MNEVDIKKKALEITNKYYPEAKCVILTGSQIEPEFLTSHSVVDIIVIDTHFASTSSESLAEDNYKIDFTRLGYLNMLDILVDSSYASSPVIFEMLKNCIILKDETGIGKLAKTFCENLIADGNNNLHNELRNLMTGLTKLKKHFLKKLDNRYSPFLLADFLNLTASSHLFIIKVIKHLNSSCKMSYELHRLLLRFTYIIVK